MPDPPQITCPALTPQTSQNGLALAVTFTPSVLLGAPPVTTSCTPASGTLFNIGTTPVSCTAIDARQRTASCSFNVVVQPPPRLRLTRFVAFGDSITAGEDGNPTLSEQLRLDREIGLYQPQVILIGREYPVVLEALLRARYTTQQPVVVKAGCSGEFAAGTSPCDPAGTFSRFRTVTAPGVFEVVLLMAGANDILGNVNNGGNLDGIPPAIANLRRMIGEARSRGIRVFLATLPPANPAGARGATRYRAVEPMNAALRTLASSEGVPLVDVFNAFNNNFSYLSVDGLHPNADGFALIASTFYDVVRRELEVMQ